jgi:hypothetical protein
MDLPHSDACLVQAYPAETAEAFCDGHNAAFAATLQHCNTATPDHARRSPGSGCSFTISGIGSPRTSAPADLCGFPDRQDPSGKTSASGSRTAEIVRGRGDDDAGLVPVPWLDEGVFENETCLSAVSPD